jgi:hypothetical protein
VEEADWPRAGTSRTKRCSGSSGCWVCLVPFSVFLARLPPARLPPVRLSACIVLLFGCVHLQSQARESRRLVACTR